MGERVKGDVEGEGERREEGEGRGEAKAEREGDEEGVGYDVERALVVGDTLREAIGDKVIVTCVLGVVETLPLPPPRPPAVTDTGAEKEA